jgi:hypothetical protein
MLGKFPDSLCAAAARQASNIGIALKVIERFVKANINEI